GIIINTNNRITNINVFVNRIFSKKCVSLIGKQILEKIKITKNANGFFDNIIKKFKKSIALFRRN
ncbi:hypothetical protein J2P69_02485, partial [Enterococcus faecium]|uniref:hypothetical protein n=2 Tax=Enterococcus faecium TaxID=1352 RepID=UPI000534EBC4